MSIARSLLALVGTLIGLVLATPIVMLCLPFWIVGSLTHWLARLLEPGTVSWEEVIQFDPVLGWKPKANLNTYCSFAAGIFRVRTDSLGWSGKSTVAESEIMIFGDSFAFGFGVNAEHMFADLNPKVHIKSIGAPGYNMVQEFILMQQLSTQLRDKLVVWLICFSNDLYDNLLPNLYQYRMPFLRTRGTDGWEIASKHVTPSPWPFNPERNSRRSEKLDGTFGNGFLSRRVYSGCEFLIEKGKDLCARSGASLVLMTIPLTMQLDAREWKQVFSSTADKNRFDPELPDKKLAKICSKLNVPLIAGKDHFDLRHFIAGEGHWNENGHRRMGEILGELYHRYNMERHSTKQSRRAGFSDTESPGAAATPSSWAADAQSLKNFRVN